MVDAWYTSQTCFKCGYKEKANRNGAKFKCKKCGHMSHADLNASKNIAVSATYNNRFLLISHYLFTVKVSRYKLIST